MNILNEFKDVFKDEFMDVISQMTLCQSNFIEPSILLNKCLYIYFVEFNCRQIWVVSIQLIQFSNKFQLLIIQENMLKERDREGEREEGKKRERKSERD